MWLSKIFNLLFRNSHKLVYYSQCYYVVPSWWSYSLTVSIIFFLFVIPQLDLFIVQCGFPSFSISTQDETLSVSRYTTQTNQIICSNTASILALPMYLGTISGNMIKLFTVLLCGNTTTIFTIQSCLSVIRTPLQDKTRCVFWYTQNVDINDILAFYGGE